MVGGDEEPSPKRTGPVWTSQLERPFFFPTVSRSVASCWSIGIFEIFSELSAEQHHLVWIHWLFRLRCRSPFARSNRKRLSLVRYASSRLIRTTRQRDEKNLFIVRQMFFSGIVFPLIELEKSRKNTRRLLRRLRRRPGVAGPTRREIRNTFGNTRTNGRTRFYHVRLILVE